MFRETAKLLKKEEKTEGNHLEAKFASVQVLICFRSFILFQFKRFHHCFLLWEI